MPAKKEKIRVLQQIDTASFGGDDVPGRGKLYDIIENTSTENASSAKKIQTHHSKVTSLENAESLVTKGSKKNQGQTDEPLGRKTTFAPA